MRRGLPFAVGTVSVRDERLVSAARRLLTAVADCDDPEKSDLKLERFLDRAARSSEHTDAAFAAVQELRDMDELEPCEAAYVFDSLYEVWQDEIEQNNPTQRGAELEAEFHHARGERGLAAMALERPDAYRDLLTDGTIMLVEGKVAPGHSKSFEPNPRLAALVAERLIALAATEEMREVIPAWRSFWDAQDIDDPASTVAAVQSLRGLGIITFEESAGLIDEVAGTLARTYMDTDRQCMRWERKMAVIEAASGPIEEGAEPFEYRALRQLVERRADGIQATCLRRLGEHELAALLIEDRSKYERLREGDLPGAWGANSDQS